MRKPTHDKRHLKPYGDSNPSRGVIIHTTESSQVTGPSDRVGIANFLANSRGLSVPVIVDNEGSTEMVPTPFHGEHAACVDGCFGVEQIARAGWTRVEWYANKETIRNAAQWTAWWLATQLHVAVNERNLKKLVVGHDRDHVFGGCSDHWDPGPNYPWELFRRYAIEYAREKGWRVVAVKGERRKVRRFRATRRKQLRAYVRKRINAGWKVVVFPKRRIKSDLD